MSKSDILKGNTSFFIYVCALEIGVFIFITTMCAHFSNLNDSTTLMLKAHKWIPTTLFIMSAIGWVFHGIYASNHEAWFEHEEDHVLSYTLWYLWYILTFSWAIYYPAIAFGIICKFIFYDCTIGLIRLLSGTRKKKTKQTITEQYDTLLKR